MSATVYFSRTITPEKVLELYKLVNKELPGNVEEFPGETYDESELFREEDALPVIEEEREKEGELEEPAEETMAGAPVYEEYIVQSGDTLAKISREFYGTDEKISEICILNNITNGDYIQAGEIILLP